MAQRQQVLLPADAHYSAPDPEVPAAELRSLLEAALAQHGQAAGALLRLVDGGGSLGLAHLANVCRGVPKDGWPDIVAAHIAGLAARTPPDPFEPLTVEQVLRGTYLQLRAVGSLTDPSAYPYARQVAPGIVELVVLHHRKKTVLLDQADLDRFGGLDLLRQKGLANLRKVSLTDENIIDTPGVGYFRLMTGSSPFTASRLLTDAPLATGYSRRTEENPLGMLAAMPTGQRIAIHVIRDGRAGASLAGLAAYARLAGRAAADPLSPHVYWVRKQHFEQVTSWDEKGELQVGGSAEFARLLADLATIGTIRLAPRPQPTYQSAPDYDYPYYDEEERW